MNYRTALPHWLFACLVPWIILILLLRKPYHFELGIQSLLLHLIVVCRVGMALNLWQLAEASQLPQHLVNIAIVIELVWGIGGGILAIPSVRKSINPIIKSRWHYAGFGAALLLCTVSWFTAPGTWQLLAFDRPNYVFMHFPFVWLPSVVWPAIAWAHWVLARKPIPGPSSELS